MAYWINRALIPWVLVVQFTVALRLGKLRASRAHDTNPDWVEKILHDTAKWEPIVAECAKEKKGNNNHTNLDHINVTDLGLLDEYSDLPPRVLDWVQLNTDEFCGNSCVLPNHTDVIERRHVNRTRKVQTRFMEIEYPSTTGSCIALPVRVDDHGPIHTCKFDNLYVFNGSYIAHIIKGDAFPALTSRVVLRSGNNPRMLSYLLRVRTHASYGALQLAIHALGHTPKLFDGMTLAYQPLWHFNIGHALYDGLYPAFVSAITWSKHNEPFHVLFLGGHNAPNVVKMLPGAFERNEKVIELITGKSLIRSWVFDELPDYYFGKFDTIIFGMGANGQKVDVNANFSLGSSRALGAAQLFRRFVYNSFQIQPRVSPGDTLQGIIVHNRRWGEKKPSWVDLVSAKVAKQKVRMQYIMWGVTGTEEKRTSPSPPTEAFIDQLRLVSKTDIYLSSPGTAIMYQHFLPDGAVVINMGEDPALPRHFMEEYMTEGAPYIRALYYWPVGSHGPIYAQENVEGACKSYNGTQIENLILEATQLVRTGFQMPVPVNVNLSPVTRVLKVYEFLTQNKSELENLRPLRVLVPKFEAFETNWFGNHFPHEFLRVGERPRGLNSCLLRALTEDYGEPCPGCSWGFP